MYSGGGGVSVSSSTKLAYQSKQGKQHKSASVAASTPTVGGGGVDRLPNSKSDQTNLTASTTAAGYNNVQNTLYSCFCQPRSFDRIHNSFLLEKPCHFSNIQFISFRRYCMIPRQYYHAKIWLKLKILGVTIYYYLLLLLSTYLRKI